MMNRDVMSRQMFRNGGVVRMQQGGSPGDAALAQAIRIFTEMNGRPPRRDEIDSLSRMQADMTGPLRPAPQYVPMPEQRDFIPMPEALGPMIRGGRPAPVVEDEGQVLPRGIPQQEMGDYLRQYMPGEDYYPPRGDLEGYRHGGMVHRYANGGMAANNDAMAMEAAAGLMPTAPGPEVAAGAQSIQQGLGAMAQNIDPVMMERMLAAAAEDIGDPETAQDFEQMMNMVRGDQATITERRAELANVVGEQDAQQTPDSVLALVQPIMQMAAVDEGIGGLAAEEMTTPVEGDMAEGVMSLASVPEPMPAGPMMQEAGSQPPANFSRGGEVQYFAPQNDNRVAGYPFGGITKQMEDIKPATYDPTAIRGTYEGLLPFYKEVLADPGARDRAQANMLFSIAQAGLNLASNVDPRTGKQMEGSLLGRLGGAFSTVPQTVSEELAALRKIEETPKLAALQAAQAEAAATREAAAKNQLALLQGAIAGAQQAQSYDFTRQRDESAQAHAMRLQDRSDAIQREIQKLRGSQDLAAIDATAKYNRQLADINNESRKAQADRDLEGRLKELAVRNTYEINKMELASEKDDARTLLSHRLTIERAKLDQDFQRKYKDLEAEDRRTALDSDAEYKKAKLALDREEARLKASTPEYYTATTSGDFPIYDRDGRVVGQKSLTAGQPVAVLPSEMAALKDYIQPYEKQPGAMAAVPYLGQDEFGDPKVISVIQKGREFYDADKPGSAPLPMDFFTKNNFVPTSPDTVQDKLSDAQFKRKQQLELDALGVSDAGATTAESLARNINARVSALDAPQEFKSEADKKEHDAALARIRDELKNFGIDGVSTDETTILDHTKKLGLATQAWGWLGQQVSRTELFGGWGEDVAAANKAFDSFGTLFRISLAASPKLAEGEQARLGKLFIQSGAFGTSPAEALPILQQLKQEANRLYMDNTRLLAQSSSYLSESEKNRALLAKHTAAQLLTALRDVPRAGFSSEERQYIFGGPK